MMSEISILTVDGVSFNLSDDKVRGSLSEVEMTPRASKTYAAGDYLIYQGRFYKVVQVIDQDSFFEIGTNIIPVTVGEELESKASLESPTFSGSPKVPTAGVGTRTTQIASTAYVQSELDSVKERIQSVQNGLDGIDSNIGDRVTAVATSTTTAWMNAHITNTDSVLLDTSLTVEGAAADAKAVGDALDALSDEIDSSIDSRITSLNEDLSDVNERLDTIANTFSDKSMWTQGSFDPLTGEQANSASRIRTAYIPSYITDIVITEGYGAVICCYNNENTFIGTWNGTTAAKVDPPTTFTGTVSLIELRTYKLRIYAKKLTNANVTPVSDYAGVCFVKYTDDTLSKSTVPADAKATGDAINAIESELLDITQPFVKLTKGSSIFTVEEGYYATTGNKTALAGYVLCSYTADIDFEIYADATTLAGTIALFVSIYNDSIASGNNVVCYKRNTQENTLPTEANKATVHAGQILAISIYTPATNPADFGIYADYQKVYALKPNVAVQTKFTNFTYSKKIAWFGDSISELKQLPHRVGNLLSADVYDCSVRGSTIGRTYSNFDEFSFYNLVTSIVSGDFEAQFDQLDAYEQAQGQTYPGIRENLTTLSNLDFSEVDYVVLLQGTNDFGITAVHAATGYDTKVEEMQYRMDDAINRFITAYPHLKFFILSPLYRATPTEDYYGDTLANYVEAEKTVAEKYAIPFYNLLTHSRICAENKATYMNSDGGVYVHPNDYGDAWLAELSAKFISVN
jgi:lysophospholipase L1-like esterase